MSTRDEVTITVQAQGPYLVRGGPPLTRRSPVVSEHGEPLTWRTTARLDRRDPVALCRCGGSATKPYCDGTHARTGFDGTEAAPTSTYDERARSYPGTGIVVRDDRSVCEHAGFCGNRLTNVWKMVAEGETEDSVARAQVMSMVEHCPSGALTYRIDENSGDVEPEVGPAVAVTADGPYLVIGGVRVERSDGRPFEPRNRVTLCRCGQSARKPLCDGSHRLAGFADA